MAGRPLAALIGGVHVLLTGVGACGRNETICDPIGPTFHMTADAEAVGDSAVTYRVIRPSPATGDDADGRWELTAASLAATVERLRTAGCAFAEDEAAVLVDAARSDVDLDGLVARRVAGLPLEQVVGWAVLCGRRIAVDPGVFVPRRRTELLVAEALRLAPAGAVVVDLCCGAGGIGTVITAGRDDVELHAADIDPAAVACARRNLAGAGVVHEGDLFDALPPALAGRVDVLVANTPYVPTDEIGLLPPEARLHEPRLALDGGPDGLAVQRRVLAGAGRWLAPGGHLLVEVAEHQVPAALTAFADAGLVAHDVHEDDLGATVIVGDRSART